MVSNFDLFQRRQVQHAQFVVPRDKRPCSHIIFNSFRQPGENELIGRATARVVLLLHGHRFPSGGARVMREQPRLVGMHPGHVRGDQLIAVSSHRDIPRSHSNGIERSGAAVGPEHGSPIAQVPGSFSDHPYQHGEASHSRAAESEQTVVWNQRMRLGLLGVRQRVRSQQLQKRDRKSTRLNSSHGYISYAVFCLKKKKKKKTNNTALRVISKQKYTIATRESKIYSIIDEMRVLVIDDLR